jgi:hypothetical protein
MFGKHSKLSRRPQFSLSTLLLIPLVFAPLIISLCEAAKVKGGSTPEWDLWVFALGFAFAFALTFISYRRRLAAGAFNTNRPFWWFLFHGVLYGVVCYALLFGPIFIVMAMNTGQVLEMIGFFALIIALPSTVIGAAAGGILGLLLSADKQKLLPQAMRN